MITFAEAARTEIVEWFHDKLQVELHEVSGKFTDIQRVVAEACPAIGSLVAVTVGAKDAI